MTDSIHQEPRAPDDRTPPAAGRRGRWPASAWALLGVLIGFAALRLAAIPNASINWDEFALLAQVDKIAVTGSFQTGGRPGLAVWMLWPLVEACVDEISVVQRARVVWWALTLAYLVGLAALAVTLRRPGERSYADGLIAVLLLAWLPVFAEWSVQVRTDQIALAAGTWGGVALLASAHRRGSPGAIALALLAGALLGIGFLATQKLLYVAAAVGLLAAGQLLLEREIRPLREGLRAFACAAGFLLVFHLYGSWLTAGAHVNVPGDHAATGVARAIPLQSGLAVFDFYRDTLGYRQYLDILPSLAPHALFGLALCAATLVAIRRHSDIAGLLLAWALLAAGAAVALFHAAAFAYFWMTLGLFPALAFAVARRDVEALVLPPGARYTRVAVVGWWLVLALPGAAGFLDALRDSQAVQRDSLAFVQRNFAPSDRGFHPEGSLFCAEGKQAVGTHFSQDIYRLYGVDPELRDRNVEKMQERFRTRPIKFLVQSFRLNQFPVELRRFWSEHYQPYRDAVFVAGRRIEGPAGGETEFELLMEGLYRWLPAAGREPLRIGEEVVGAGDVVRLEEGRHTATFLEDVPAGMLVLALAEPPGAAPRRFYEAN